MERIGRLAAIILLSLFTLPGHSQDYDTGLGVRGSVAWGITVKHFVMTDGAIEGLLTARFNGFNATGLYEKHIPVFDTDGFYFFYGGGVHLGLWNTDDPTPFRGTKIYTGIDGIIGLEYSFGGTPISLGIDWKPGFNLLSDFGFYFDEIAISIRYLFR